MITTTAAYGWANNLVIQNDVAEVIVTLDVGPRIISYRLIDKENVFHVEQNDLGGAAEPEFKLRGGHRLWLAPESSATYYPDNHPVLVTQDDEFSATLTAPSEVGNNIEKVLRISLDESSSAVSVQHIIRATADLASPVSAWALSVMRGGGVADLPIPRLGRHPDESETESVPSDYLPNRKISLWNYTDLSDTRFEWQPDRLLIHQLDRPATKIGFQHQLGSVSYRLEDQTFTKSVPFLADAEYPDNGSNLEVFTNSTMLELETLSPLKLLHEGESIIHEEAWQII